MSETLSKVEREMIQRIYANPVLWAKAYLVTYDGSKKEYTPWTARWYQAEMLQDKSLRKVYRCGRRTGKVIILPSGYKLRERFLKSNRWT